MQEPRPETLRSPALRLFLATRPPFLLATLVPVGLGLALAAHQGAGIDPLAALLTVLAALSLHAGVNVLNDYFDARNGTDAINRERIFPFTGGSRFIQNGILGADTMRRLGTGLLVGTTALGLVLTGMAGPGLVPLGLAGIALGWAYSAPPLALNSRGLGEFCVLAGFGLLPLGAFYVQTGVLDPRGLWVGLPQGLLTAALLYINQFPDRVADRQAGKFHWVARLEPRSARWGYWMMAGGAYLGLALLVAVDRLPVTALAGLATLPLSLAAAVLLGRHAHRPRRLGGAITLTLAAMLAHGLLVSLALLLA